jgi:hypothetical protein
VFVYRRRFEGIKGGCGDEGGVQRLAGEEERRQEEVRRRLGAGSGALDDRLLGRRWERGPGARVVGKRRTACDERREDNSVRRRLRVGKVVRGEEWAARRRWGSAG